MKRYDIEITDNGLLDMGPIERLEAMPARYPIIKSGELERREIRLVPVDNYSVLYFVRENSVVVMDVFYNGTDIRSRFKGDKVRDN